MERREKMWKQNKLLAGIGAVLIIIGLFSILGWAIPRVQMLVDEDEKYRYEEEKRLSSIADAYTYGYRFGEEAAKSYEGDIKNVDLETISLQLYEKKEPSDVYVIGSGGDFIEFPDEDYFVKWKNNDKGTETNNLVAAFKSGYIDGFIQYYED